ncbi:hypothetical protein [Algirhabdus cladophorae]|uniref:hypothetical protein n=1 Tax=Algirhabdus cladophorae TaxID=3377108 RepID=UPI003B847328
MNTVESARSAAMARAGTIKISAVAIKRADEDIFGRKWKGFCLPILCFVPPCPCTGGPIVWWPKDDILLEEETGEKTAEGMDLLSLTVNRNADARFEMQLSLRSDTIRAIQRGKVDRSRGCKPSPTVPGSMAKGVSITDALGGPGKLVKAAFLGGYFAGGWLDDQLDGGLSDQAADYIESVADFFDDLWD